MRNMLIAAVVPLALAASAADKRETRNVSGFNGLGVSAPIRVELSQGAADSLAVQGEESALAELETYVENGSLVLRQRDRRHVKYMDKVKAYVTMRDVRAITAAGAGDLVAGPLRAGDLRLAVAGSGDVHIASLAAGKLSVAVAGSGSLAISAGKADAIEASVTGSGDLQAGKLEAADVKVTVAGSGAAAVWARSSLTATAVGSGDVRYYGDPPVRKTSTRGSGTVHHAGAGPS